MLDIVCKGVYIRPYKQPQDTHMTTRKLSDIPQNTILFKVAKTHLINGLPYSYTQVDKVTKAEIQVKVINA
jgi:hypothetical protein